MKLMSPAKNGQVGGDTTKTKVFVGGLAWETQKETMEMYFQQFGDIYEAVVITDRSTGRSKGYGFVTFREPEAAKKACVDATPVIDGRRANCNLACLGLQRSKPSTPKLGGGGGKNLRGLKCFQSGCIGGTTFPSTAATSFPYYAIQPGIPFNFYRYSPDYTYPTSYYNVYGGAAAQYPMYGNGPVSGAMMTSAAPAFYPYLQFGEGTRAATTGYTSGQGYGVQYPHHLFPYSTINAAAGYPQHYGPSMSLAPTPALQPGVTNMALHSPPIPYS